VEVAAARLPENPKVKHYMARSTFAGHRI